MLVPLKRFRKRFILKVVLTTILIFFFSTLNLYLSPALSEENKPHHRVEICDTLILEYDKNEGLVLENKTKEDQIIECLTKKAGKIADIPRNIILNKATQIKKISTSSPRALYTLLATNSLTKKSKSIGIISVRLTSENNEEKIKISELDFLIDKYINKKIQSEIKENLYCPKEVIFDKIRLFCVSETTNKSLIINRINNLIKFTIDSPVVSHLKVKKDIKSASIIYELDYTTIKNQKNNQNTNEFLIAKVTKADLNILPPEEFNFIIEDRLLGLALIYKDRIAQALEHHKLTEDCLSSAQLVNPESQPLFCIKSWIGNDLSPKNRAEKARKKIKHLKETGISPDSLGIVPINSIRSKIEITDFRSILNDEQITNDSVAIFTDSESLNQNENLITIVTSKDAAAENALTEVEASPIKLAESHLYSIKNYISQKNTSASVKFLGGLIGFEDFIDKYEKKYSGDSVNKPNVPHPEKIFEIQDSGEQFDANFRAWTISERLNNYVKNGQYRYRLEIYSQDTDEKFHKEDCHFEESDEKNIDSLDNIFIGNYQNRIDDNQFIIQVQNEDLKNQFFTGSIKVQKLKYACQIKGELESIINFYRETFFPDQIKSLLFSSLWTILIFLGIGWISSSIMMIKEPLKFSLSKEIIFSFSYFWHLLIFFFHFGNSLMEVLSIQIKAIKYFLLSIFCEAFEKKFNSINKYLPQMDEIFKSNVKTFKENIKAFKTSIKIFNFIIVEGYKFLLISLLLLFIHSILQQGIRLFFLRELIFSLFPLIAVFRILLRYIQIFRISKNTAKIVKTINRVIVQLTLVISIFMIWIFYLEKFSYAHNFSRIFIRIFKRGIQLLEYYLKDHLSDFTISIILVLLGILIISFFIEKIFSKTSRKNAATALAWVFTIALIIIIIAQHLPGTKTPYFAGFSAFVLLAFSLSSQTLIADFITGIILIFFTEVDEGHWIEVCGICGEIKEQTVLVHRIRTSKHELITIPNNVVFNSKVTNYTAEKNRSDMGPLVLSTSVTIGYDVPWQKVEALLLLSAWDVLSEMEIAPKKDIDQGDGKRCPYVLQTALDDFYVKYELCVPISSHTVFNTQQDSQPQKNIIDKLPPKIYSELHKNIQEQFGKAKIEILSPHFRQAYRMDKLVIPEEYYKDEG